MKPLCLLLALILYAPVAHAQIKMATSGNVAAGTTSVDSNSKLYSHYQGSFTGTRRALRGFSQTGTTSIGVFGVGSNGSTANYGVSGVANNGGTNYGVHGAASYGTTNYGVYGTASNGTVNWAGYFAGNVYATGTITSSDARLKEGVRSLSEAGAIASLMQLRPTSYRYSKDSSYDRLGLPDGDHFGLVAQELEAVFPNLVSDVIQPAEFDENGNETEPEFKFKGINYTELIPVLIQAIQEQQARIDSLEAAVGQR